MLQVDPIQSYLNLKFGIPPVLKAESSGIRIFKDKNDPCMLNDKTRQTKAFAYFSETYLNSFNQRLFLKFLKFTRIAKILFVNTG